METDKNPPSEEGSRNIQDVLSTRERQQTQQASSSQPLKEEEEEERKQRHESASSAPKQEQRNTTIKGSNAPAESDGDVLPVLLRNLDVGEKSKMASKEEGAESLTSLLLTELENYIKNRERRGSWKLQRFAIAFQELITDGKKCESEEYPFDSREHLQNAFKSELDDSIGLASLAQAEDLAATLYSCLQTHRQRLATARPEEHVSPFVSDGRTAGDTSISQRSSKRGIDTPTFVLLRRLVKDPEQASSIEVPNARFIVDKLVQLRSRAQTLLQNADTSDDANVDVCAGFEQLFVDVWTCFSSLSEYEHPWAMPPPYRTAQVKEYIKRTAEALVLCELGRRPVGGNDILHGVKGVGKTTLLLVTGLVTAVLCDHAIPIYWTYETEKFPPAVSDLLHSLCECRGLSVKALVEFDRSTWCFSKKEDTVSNALCAFPNYVQKGVQKNVTPPCSPVLLLDEFTKLYYVDDHHKNTESRAKVRRGEHIMNGLQVFGKEKNVMAVLAASTWGIERYVEPVEGGVYQGYPNMNNSVYMRRHVLPIRQKVEMKDYVLARHGRTIDEQQALKLLSTTGGIGRYVALKCAFNPKNVDDMRIPLSTPSVRDILGDSRLFAVAVALLAEYPGERNADAWKSWGIRYETAVGILKGSELSDARARQKIEGWIDASFFIVIGEQLEFLFPNLGRQLDETINLSEDYSLARILSLTLNGLKGGCMGASNESFICKYLPEYLDPLASKQAEDTLEFLGDGTVAWEGDSESEARINDVNDIIGLLCKWKVKGHETGIDRFWMIKTSEQPLTVDVNSMQLKTGRKDMKTTPGVLATQRAYERVSDMDDTCIAGLLSKAERGFSELMPALRRAFPAVIFKVRRVTFYTTKASATDAAIEFGRANPEHRASLQVTKRALARTIFGRQKNEIPWSIQAGTDWLQTTLPSSITKLAL